jgi:hypothetical protein
MPAPKEGNPVWMLFFAYFMPCDQIYQHCEAIRPRFFNPATRDEVSQQFMAHLHIWIALLYVVAEGFKELQLDDPSIDPIIDAHLDEMRLFRNSVFHFQKDDRKRVQFHGADQLNWARQLHVAFQRFFTAQENS